MQRKNPFFSSRNHEAMRINNRIVVFFNTIDSFIHNEHDCKKEVKWLIEEIKKEASNEINIITIIQRLSNLIPREQETLNHLVEFSFQQLESLLKNTAKKNKLHTGELAQLLSSFSKIGNATKFSGTILALLDQKDFFTPRDSANILGAMSKLAIKFEAYSSLMDKLLAGFENTETLEELTMSELWQFCIFAKSRNFSHALMPDLFMKADLQLKNCPRIPTRTEPQATAYNFILALLPEDVAITAKEEYPVGAYLMDIALPSLKLNIEIDGDHHYRNGQLRRIDKFRDYILDAYEKWSVIRIPLAEWSRLDKDDKKKYIIKKLSPHVQFKDEELDEKKALSLS